MSKDESLQPLHQRQRLEFLFNASFNMFSSCPSLSRYYMNEFQSTLTEYDLTTVKHVERLACKSCGQITVPGLSASVSVIAKYNRYLKKRDRMAKKTNRVQVQCLACHHSRLYHGSHKKKIPTSNPSVQSTPKPSNKKKNKGKKNNLQALLQKKSPSDHPGGNLSDFLSSL
ncbi:RNAse P Rpr2/Rpp21/SNM1 subunit domain-containing protein [Pilobolus umbonatus]|nr:RNAse P Rpr2/Rpp21/SNM1 subunit domain-containing protein [Pilobolus umbonatus]